MPEGDLYMPDGAWLVCDKGAMPLPFVATPKKFNLYGPPIGTTTDNIPAVNIPLFGACSITRAPCLPAAPQWIAAHGGAMTVLGNKPLLMTSYCKCQVGGTITAFLIKAEADAAQAQNEKSRVNGIGWLDEAIGSALMGPAGRTISMLDGNSPTTTNQDIGRGFRKGLKGTWNFFKYDIKKAETWEGMGKMVAVGVVGYGAIPILPPSVKLATFDALFNTKLTKTDDDIGKAISTTWDQKVVHGTKAERGEVAGQTVEMVVEAVVGSKGVGVVKNALTAGTKLAIGAERMTQLTEALARLGQASRLGSLVEKVKGIFIVGLKRIFNVSDEILEKILWGQRKPPGNKLIGGHSNEISNLHPNYAVEEIGYSAINPKCRKVKFITQFEGGNLSKIKTSTLFPDGWGGDKIKTATEAIANNNKLTRTIQSTGTSFKTGVYEGIEIQVTFDNAGNITGAFPL